jgi:fatty-acyl-CoA synthase
LVTERRPEDDALVYVDWGLRYSYAEFQEVVEMCAQSLMALGLEKGDHVAVWGQNVPEWVTLQFATGKTGTILVTIVLVTINPAYKSNELRYLLEQSDAAALFLTEGVKDTDFVEILKEAVPDLADAEPGEELEIEGLPYLKHVVLIGDEASTNLPGTVGYDEFVKGTEKVSDDSLHERQGALDADEAINMRYIETGIDLEALIGCAQLLEELLERELPGQVMKAGICGHLKEGS